MADDTEFEFLGAAWAADEAKWRAEHPVDLRWPTAGFGIMEAEWRRQTLDVLRQALAAYDDDPRAPFAVDRLLAAARLAVS